MRSSDREPTQGGEKSSRNLVLVMFGIIIFLLAMFLIVRPRGSESGAGQDKTTQH
jgi:flagellar basal body-associated protein FliL